jgi:hypothetical protein
VLAVQELQAKVMLVVPGKLVLLMRQAAVVAQAQLEIMVLVILALVEQALLQLLQVHL